MALAVEVGSGLTAAVRIDAVPDEEDVTSDVATQVADEPKDLGRSHRTRVQCKKGPSALVHGRLIPVP